MAKNAAKDMKFKMHSGDMIPYIGLGTYLVDGRACKDIIDKALETGYRLFDTAKMYGNEVELGRAFKELLPKHNLKREDIFITTKLLPSDHGSKAYDAIKESLKKLDCDYLDLYLIHWPGTYGGGNASKLRAESWKQMVKAKHEGLIRNLGVSNYLVRHLKELMENDHGVNPSVNQIEWHANYHPYEVLEFCKKEGILVQAYMPLGGATGKRHLLKNKDVLNIATKLGKTPAQILLRWSLQQGVAVIPKASSEGHMKENIELDFTIPDDDMATLGQFEEEKYDWDPESIP